MEMVGDRLEMLPRPLAELYQAVPELLGQSGSNRARGEQAQTQAQDDVQALESFLSEYSQSPGTLRIYRRECERLYLWAWLERGCAVSSLTREDFESYIDFLKDPQPARRWCGPKAPKESERWRPFVAPLDMAAVRTALAALNSMMSWLVDAGYLAGNPLGLIRQRLKKANATLGNSSSQAPAWLPGEGAKVERFLDEEMWAAVTQAVEGMPRATPKEAAEYERMRFVCAALYLLAPRAGELENQRMNSFREERGLWWWHVHGKGDKWARVPVPDDMMEALVRYRQFLGLTAVPSPSDMTPLLVSTRTRVNAVSSEPIKGVTARRLNQLLKELFMRAADLLPERAAHKKDKLLRASAHWGRHTAITAKVDSGMDPRYVQKDARHADPRTTGMYTHEEERRWHEESQKQRLPWADGPVQTKN